MKIKKIAVLSATLIAILFSTTFSISAQAHTVEPAIPTYGLYCENSELIKSGSVGFDFTDNELFSDGKCNKQSEYLISAANREVEFAIPFVSSAMKLPDIAVAVNGQKVEGTVWYGNSGFWADYDFDIDKTYSPVLDESITGTLYTFIPDSEIVTVSLKLNEWKSYIYETTNYYSSSYDTEYGRHTWTLKEASPLHEYSFFIFGDPTESSFESSCGYQAKTITCKEYIDSQYEYFKEYYDHNGGVPIELFYSVVNRVIQEKTIISHSDLFSHSIDTYRVNAYKFRVMLENDSVISYELPADIQINYGYKPYVYYVEQRNIGNYLVSYSIKMRDDVPYIIESNETTARDSVTYTAETEEDFGFYFSASNKPQSINTDNNRFETWQIVLFVLLGVALIVSLAMLIIYSVKYKKARKGNK